jgi:predicted Rossmann fold flavoprotein
MAADNYDAVVLGAGAAGLMCAAVAGQRGRRVLLIDHAERPGNKILISGGGRCNFTNMQVEPGRLLSSNPHFAKSALARYTPEHFLALVERYRIAWHEKTLGQLFCDGSARQIVDMLLDECAAGQVEIALGRPINHVDHGDGHYRVRFGDREVTAGSLVIATGGLSIPKLGATGFAYELGRRFSLKIVEPRPALVPLTLSGDQLLFRTLAGVSANVIVRCNKAYFQEAALFTHRGLSGPAILQISSYWRHGDRVLIDFLPARASGWLRQAKRTSPRTSIARLLATDLPERLADILSQRLSPDGDLANLPDHKLEKAEQTLAAWPFNPNGSEGFAKAEVTVGGISTANLSSQTMEAKQVPGLYAIGEAIDVTGWLGGYNFQWAWASGWAAGQAIRPLAGRV